MNSFRDHLHALRRLVQNLTIDLRFGGWLGGPGKAKPASYASLGAYGFTNTGYRLMAQMFEGRIDPDDVLVDVGCGRGRVLNYWLHMGHRGPIFGLELDEEYAESASRRLKQWPNVKVCKGDAVDNLPREGSFFYLFNPFDAGTMRRFRDAMRRKVDRIGGVRIVYFAPTCMEVWIEDPFWRVDLFDLAGMAGRAERHRSYALIAPAHSRPMEDGAGGTKVRA